MSLQKREVNSGTGSFSSFFWPVFCWDTCAQPQSKQRQMAPLIIQNRRSLGVSMFRCICRATQYPLATGTDLKRRRVKVWACAKILNVPFEQLWFDMKAGRKNARVILIRFRDYVPCSKEKINAIPLLYWSSFGDKGKSHAMEKWLAAARFCWGSTGWIRKWFSKQCS